MMEKEPVIVEKQTSNNGYLAALYKKLTLIILSVVLGVLVGLGLGIMLVKPVYTKTTTVILITEYSSSSGASASNSSQMTLARLYLPTIGRILASNDFVEDANKLYDENGGQGDIDGNAIKVKYNIEGSLIFDISYTDVSYELAEAKLNAVVKNAQASLTEKLVADNAIIKETTNIHQESYSYDYNLYIIVGFLAGAILSVGYVTIKYLLDNTIKDRFEIEEITGVNVIACIDYIPDEDEKTITHHK